MKKMKIILLMATTADGKIARDDSHFPDWTSKADKQMFKTMSQKAGVVIMGSRTYQTIGKPLPNRLNVVMTRHPHRFQPQSNLVFFSDTPDHLVEWLKSRGYQTAILAGGATINSIFLNYQLIDEMIISVIPIVFGQGISLFSEPTDASLSLVDYRMIGHNIIVLRYRFNYQSSTPIRGIV